MCVDPSNEGIAIDVPIGTIKNQCFFISIKSACVNISNDESLFESDHDDVNALAECMKYSNGILRFF